jgi:Putative Flp pilus-assembly TadE/G-like
MKTYLGRGTDERGAILIQVAISILSLTAFSAFVVDYGVLWVARGQAQNAADAGALAGATARAFDDTADPPATTTPFNSAKLGALCASRSAGCPTTAPFANPVWPSQAGASSAVEVFWDCPPTFSGKCVHVNVYRDGSNGSTALPTFFGPLLRVTSQGVKATASARVFAANATNCMRPFALADKWTESVSPATDYNHWTNAGELTPHDVYTPPSAGDPGTGYKWPADRGYYQTLVPGSTTDATIGNGWSLMVDLPDGNGGYISGGSDLRTAISTCIGHPVKIGQYLPTENAGTGPIKQGAGDLISEDPGATWDPTTKTVQGSCAPGTCPIIGYAPYSPRIVPIAVFDVDEFQHRKVNSDSTPCPTGGQCVKVVNILGFFVSSYLNDGTVYGYLTSSPGEFLLGPQVNAGASFLDVIQIVR